VVVAGQEVRGYIWGMRWWVPQGNGGDEEWGFLCNGLRLGGNVLIHAHQAKHLIN